MIYKLFILTMTENGGTFHSIVEFSSVMAANDAYSELITTSRNLPHYSTMRITKLY